MADLNGDIEAAKVGDDGDAKGLDATLVGDNHLRYGAHANSVTAQQTVHAVLCRCLEGRSLYTDIDSIRHADVFLLGNLRGFFYQFVVVGLMHIRKAGTSGEVLAAQRMLREEVDVVGNDHQVANLECRVHATGSIRHEERLDAQFVHDTYREGHFLHRVAFIEVEAALHGEDIDTAKLAENQFAAVSFNG